MTEALKSSDKSLKFTQVKVGIALAAYEPNLEYFAQQLKSIQNQTHSDWVCIITFDSPIQKVLSSTQILPFQLDSRFVWSENKIRLGHKKNFQGAIQQALKLQVEVIACSDQDDIWYPEKLSECLSAYVKMSALSLVHSDMHVLRDGKTSTETAWDIERRGIHHTAPSHFYVRNIVAGCSMLFDAELARRYPEIPEEAEFHDHWYALVASYHGGIGAVAKPLYAYRQHRENEVGVSPFQSVLAVPAGTSFLKIVGKCVNGWKKSYRLAQAAKRAGLPVNPTEKMTFLSYWDFGLGLLFIAFASLLPGKSQDLPLARASLARGFGKIFKAFGFSGTTASR